MGYRMDNIHAPTVASGPSSTRTNGAEEENMSLPQLIAKKDRVWSELSALGSILDSVSCVPSRYRESKLTSTGSMEST
jgi:26S proteasome non-ATPase regulatory subunit 9